MRKIEFRGKRIDNGEWAYGNLLVNSDGTTAILTFDNTCVCCGYVIHDKELLCG